jgi:hypothetical protein
VLNQFNKNAVPDIKSEFDLIIKSELESLKALALEKVKEYIQKQDLSTS